MIPLVLLLAVLSTDCVLTKQAPGYGVNPLPSFETAAEQVPGHGVYPQRVPVHAVHQQQVPGLASHGVNPLLGLLISETRAESAFGHLKLNFHFPSCTTILSLLQLACPPLSSHYQPRQLASTPVSKLKLVSPAPVHQLKLDSPAPVHQ